MELAFWVGVIVGVIIGGAVAYTLTMLWKVEPLRDERDNLKQLCFYWQDQALESQNKLALRRPDDQVEWRLTDAGRKLAEGVE